MHCSLRRWCHIDTVRRGGRREDASRALTERHMVPLSGHSRRKHRAFTSLHALATWRATTLSFFRLRLGVADSKPLFDASEAERRARFICNNLRESLARVNKSQRLQASAVSLGYGGRDTLSRLVVKRLSMRGLLCEEELRLGGVLREQAHEIKHLAMLRMVQSGMLPIELKVATLGAARDEKDVNGLRAETLLLQQLLLRIRITANLRRLRRERMHRQHARCALDEAIRDLPLLMDVESSERIQVTMAARLWDAAHGLTTSTADLANMHLRKRQLENLIHRLSTSDVATMGVGNRAAGDISTGIPMQGQEALTTNRKVGHFQREIASMKAVVATCDRILERLI